MLIDKVSELISLCDYTLNAHKLRYIIAIILITSIVTLKGQDVGQVFMDNAAANQQAYMSSHIYALTLKNVLKGSNSAVESDLTYNPSVRIRDRVIDRMSANMKLVMLIV